MDKYEEFKKDIYNLTKIDLSAYKEQQMRRRIDSLIKKHDCKTYKDYVGVIKNDKEAFEEFVSFLTINVSEFYRNPEQWKLFVNEFLPELIKKFGKRLRIWSAACSTGDEPYSLVMAMSKLLDLSQIKIIATDIDKQIISQAKLGLYNEKSIAHVPDEYKKKYFTKVGKSYQIDEKIKKCVEFRQHNLLRDEYIKDCDLIVCRNVLIYFTDEAKFEVYSKFADSLKKTGILFIGNTEQIMNYATLGYKRRYSFYYEKEKNKDEIE
ncbi:MAG: protein-glutamate O-methyltransferase CheR [Lachnospiraceae bacterium]|nr:protein-glutamate O-methyltransferase CheR [Lachnospiraceae bacterium]